MKPFASRYLLLVAFSVLLGACQSTPPVAEVPDARATAIAQLEQSLASSELATAEDQLAALQAQTPNDQSLEQYQRQLAEAYLRRSQIVLQKGDVNAAATALSRARALMPKAPALTGGVNGITDLKTLLGWDLRTDSAKLILYFINAGLLFGCIFIGRFIPGVKAVIPGVAGIMGMKYGHFTIINVTSANAVAVNAARARSMLERSEVAHTSTARARSSSSSS